MDWLDISTIGWMIAYTMISIIIPYLIVSGIIRLMGRSTKKTINAFKR